jgi:hypothetical protein
LEFRYRSIPKPLETTEVTGGRDQFTHLPQRQTARKGGVAHRYPTYKPLYGMEIKRVAQQKVAV